MSSQPKRRRLELEQIGDVTVVSFVDKKILDEQSIQTIGDQLFSLVDEAGRKKILLDRFDLDPTKKARAYSKGNRQKVALVSALASDAELLIFDEPTAGLDPLMEAAFRECAEEERSRGRTMLLSSHILSEIEALCDRVTIIRAGRTVESGTLSFATSPGPQLRPSWLASPAASISWTECMTSCWIRARMAAAGCAARPTRTSLRTCCGCWLPPACGPW